jgi:DNA-directed RNA polymerase subunit RPC12/RpoP
MEFYKCDKCGKEIKFNDRNYINLISTPLKEETYDLCDECFDMVYTLIHTR